jgi:hypothetical protein
MSSKAKRSMHSGASVSPWPERHIDFSVLAQVWLGTCHFGFDEFKQLDSF